MQIEEKTRTMQKEEQKRELEINNVTPENTSFKAESHNYKAGRN